MQRAIDSPDFYSLYETMNGLDAVLWAHPARTFCQPYYKGKEMEKYELWWTKMRPIETTMTALEIPVREMGEKVFRMILDEIEAEDSAKPSAQHLVFPASLVEREST